MIARMMLHEMAYSDYNLYGGSASVPAAYIVTIAFGIILIGTFIQGARHGPNGRAWWFLMIGPIFEVIGWAFRIPSVLDPTNLVWYLCTNVIVLVGPQASAAVCYILFSALLMETDPKLCVMPAGHIAAIWLAFDMTCGGLQGAGAGQSYNGQTDTFRLGVGLIFAGMVLQWLTFLFFYYLVWVFILRIRTPQFREAFYNDKRIRYPLNALIVSCVMHVIRFTYRVVEIGLLFRFNSLNQETGPMPEAYIYIFDGLTMLVANSCIIFGYPWRIKQKNIHGPFYFFLNWCREKYAERRQRQRSVSSYSREPGRVKPEV